MHYTSTDKEMSLTEMERPIFILRLIEKGF